MRAVVLSLIGALAAASAAAASEHRPHRAPPPPPAPAPFSWAGAYVGGYAGGSAASTNMQELNGPGELAFLPGQLTSTNINPRSFIYGAYVGYNYQLAATAAVIGGELEFGGATGSATGVTNSGVIPNAPPIEDNIPTYNKLNMPWNFRARARLGYAEGNLLPFIAAGVSVTEARLGLVFPCPNFPDPGVTTYTANSSKTLTGFNIGAGVDWAVTSHIIARAEYIFDAYGTPTFAEDGSQGWNNRQLSNLQINTFRLAVGYKF